MALIIGPSKSHSSFADYLPNIALGATVCGGRLFCKSLGIAWIVAPAATQVSATWNGSSGTIVGNKPNVSDWSSLNTALTNGGLTPTQWFVPSVTQLQSGYACKTYWDSCSCGAYYSSSTEANAALACSVNFTNGTANFYDKALPTCVRAFRCVTY
jgi:hypothetical protein